MNIYNLLGNRREDWVGSWVPRHLNYVWNMITRMQPFRLKICQPSKRGEGPRRTRLQLKLRQPHHVPVPPRYPIYHPHSCTVRKRNLRWHSDIEEQTSANWCPLVQVSTRIHISNVTDNITNCNLLFELQDNRF